MTEEAIIVLIVAPAVLFGLYKGSAGIARLVSGWWRERHEQRRLAELRGAYTPEPDLTEEQRMEKAQERFRKRKALIDGLDLAAEDKASLLYEAEMKLRAEVERILG